MNKKIIGVLLTLILIPGMVFAGITGKISGRVKDAKTGNPLPGANVVVKGTDRGAATGPNGSFLINAVDVGTYDVVVSMIGYTEVTVSGVKVTANKNTELGDIKINDSSIKVGAVIIVADRPLIDPDVSVGQVVTGDQISVKPIDNLQDAVALSAGATETSGGLSGGLHMQGGRSNEVVYVVDGINANDPVTGQSGVYIDNMAVKEMTINTGNFNAEYGDAMSAVINIVTKEGGNKFKGMLAYETDAMLRFGKPAKDKEGKFYWDVDPIKYPNEKMWHNKVSLSLGGPLGIPRASFFISGNMLEHEDRLYNNDQHRKSGTLKLTWRPFEHGPKITLSGNYSNSWYHNYKHAFSKGIWASLGPRVESSNYQLNVKVSHKINEHLFYTINAGTFNTQRNVSYMNGAHYNDFKMIGRSQMSWVGWAYNQTKKEVDKETGDTLIVDRLYHADSMLFHVPDSILAYVTKKGDSVRINIIDYYENLVKNDTGWVDTATAVWYFYNQFVKPSGYYEKGEDVFHWQNWDKQLEALNDRWYEANEWRPTIAKNGDTVGVNYHLFDFALYKHYYALYRDWDSVIINGKDTVEVKNPYEDSLETSGNIHMVRYNSEPLFRRFKYYFTPYWERRNTTKYIADLALEWTPNKTHWVKMGASGNYHILDYSNLYFANENPYSDAYHKNPIIAAAYLQDKIEYEDLTLNLGVRFDYFNPASEYFVNPEFIDSGRAPTPPKYQFSPRFSVSFAVTGQSFIYASYGHFFQPVDLGDLYQNLEADITVGVPLLGNPNLPPLKTIFYQAGYKVLLDSNTAVDIKGYFKDQENLLASRQVSTMYKNKLASYTIYVIEDFAKVKGFDLSLMRRSGKMFTSSVTYSFMDAKGTGSSGREFYMRYRGTAIKPPKHEYPLEFDITHSLKTNINIHLPQDFDIKWLAMTNLNVQFNMASGKPYWGVDSKGNVIPMGSRRMPATKTVDAKFEKWFALGKLNKETGLRSSSLRVGFYIDVRNVFDWRNVSSVYSNTGLPNDNGQSPRYEKFQYRDCKDFGFKNELEYWQADVADWKEYVGQNPSNYGQPRLLRLGLRMSF